MGTSSSHSMSLEDELDDVDNAKLPGKKITRGQNNHKKKINDNNNDNKKYNNSNVPKQTDHIKNRQISDNLLPKLNVDHNIYNSTAVPNIKVIKQTKWKSNNKYKRWNRDLLAYGYIRVITQNFDLFIPNDIIIICIQFIPKGSYSERQMDIIYSTPLCFKPIIASKMLKTTLDEIVQHKKDKDHDQLQRLELALKIMKTEIMLPAYPDKTHQSLVKQMEKQVKKLKKSIKKTNTSQKQ